MFPIIHNIFTLEKIFSLFVFTLFSFIFFQQIIIPFCSVELIKLNDTEFSSLFHLFIFVSFCFALLRSFIDHLSIWFRVFLFYSRKFSITKSQSLCCFGCCWWPIICFDSIKWSFFFVLLLVFLAKTNVYFKNWLLSLHKRYRLVGDGEENKKKKKNKSWIKNLFPFSENQSLLCLTRNILDTFLFIRK